MRPLIGAYWPEQGGILAAVMPGIANGILRDVALIIPNGPEGSFEGVDWGSTGEDVVGAVSPTEGAANTVAMAAAGSVLAQAISRLEIEGHADWFLPARRQLQAIAASVPQLFKKSGYYWTSTQLSRHYAYVQDFEYGYSVWLNKGNEFRAVAVRQVTLGP